MTDKEPIKRPLNDLTPDEICGLSDQELKTLIEEEQKVDQRKAYSETESQMISLGYHDPGGGSIFLGVDETLIQVIRREAETYVVLNEVAQRTGLGERLDYDWIQRKIAEITLTVEDKDTGNYNGLIVTYMLHRFTINSTFPVEETTDYYLNDLVNPWRYMKLSLYTLNLIREIRFPEGIGALDYRLNIARLIWVARIGSEELQEAALETDFRAITDYLDKLIESLKTATVIKSEVSWGSSAFTDFTLIENRLSEEVNMILEFLLIYFPVLQNEILANKVISRIKAVRNLLDRIPSDEFISRIPDWAETITAFFTYRIPGIIETREDLEPLISEYIMSKI